MPIPRPKSLTRRKKIRDRARELRHDSTVPERILWSLLRSRQLGGLKFRRQHAVDPYVVDYYCPDHNLVIEVDGESHVGTHEQDQRRTAFLESKGLRVLRVTNDDVLHNLEAVGMMILKATGNLPD